MTEAPPSPSPSASRRHNAVRRWLWRGSAIAIAVALLFGLGVTWLLESDRGRDVLLRQLQARLPANAELDWERVEGPLAGPMLVHGVRFRYEDIAFTAQTVRLDPDLRPLLGRRLRLDALEISNATLEIPEDDAPFELPRWPESLPAIDPPLALQADAIRIDGLTVTRDRKPLVEVHSARAGLDVSRGRLHVNQLNVGSDRGRFTLHGDYAPRDNYRTDLTATAVLPAPAGRTPPRLGMVARGDLAQMDLAVSGHVPAPVRASVTLRTPPSGRRQRDAEPRWSASAQTEALDVALLLGRGETSPPLSLDLSAEGTGGRARLQGQLAWGARALRILPSQVHLADQVLTVQPLVVDVLDGRVTLQGKADLRNPDDAKLQFKVAARDLAWGGVDDTPQLVADADFALHGKPDAWTATGTAQLRRDGQRADLRFDGSGDLEQVAIRTLRATTPNGRLDASGEVRWSPQLAWELDATLAQFDPGYFFPGWDGAVDGRVTTRGQARSDGGFDARFDVPTIGGRLRGRPLSGNGRFDLRGDEIDGELALAIGASRLEARGRIGTTLAVDARFAPLQLDDLWPEATGNLRGTLTLRGPRDAPDIDVDLSGSQLRWGDWQAASLQAQGRLPWRGGNGQLSVSAETLVAGIALDSLRVDARGAVEKLQFDADTRSAFGTLALGGQLERRGNTWQGSVAALQVEPVRGATWRLQQPARFAWTPAASGVGSVTVSNACLAANTGGTLCANADWPRRGADVAGTALPLTLLTPYLPERDDGRPWLLRGDADLSAQIRPIGTSWRGNARVTATSGGLKLSESARRELLSFEGLVLEVGFDPQRIEAQLGSVLNATDQGRDGRLDARIATGWDAYAPLAGTLSVQTDDVVWLELFSPDIVEPSGRLEGTITLGGTRAQPTLGGQAQLSDFNTELPALAITLHDGNARLLAQPDGSARITGSVRSGEGTLAIDGALGWRGEQTPLVLTLRGQDVLLSDTRDLRLVADPDVVVRYAAGQPINVTGSVEVSSAKLDLERLDQGVSASPDVVVLDPVDPKRSRDAPLELDLTVGVGDDVRLKGFGLDGKLSGRVRVRERPGRETTATGSLEVTGRYKAYGRELEITRGLLNWSNNAIANPALDIRAERVVGDVTAGVQVSGRATAPQAQVWAEPAMDESEALAFLILGRSLRTATSSEGRQIDAASAALSAGGSLLASQLGAKLGLDNAGVVESRALGGSVFGIGKYLSPRVFVGYGVSLLGTGQVLTLKFLLRRGFDIQVESSTLENRASVNWRKEK